MSITVGEASAEMASGRRWYAYSGIVIGGVGVPALITLNNIPNTGLRDSFIKIFPYYGVPASVAGNSLLGFQVTIDGIVVLSAQFDDSDRGFSGNGTGSNYELFVPRQSSILVESRNTPANNTQERGCNLLGWYMR